jgi:catechol-2,3-dioxygenase
MPNSIEHVGLKAKNPKRLAEWYQKIFELKIISCNGKTPPTFFIGGEEGCLIEIMPKPEDSEILSSLQKKEVHLAIKVADFPAMVDKLRNNAINIGNIEYKPNITNMAFFADPEDNWVQVVYRPTPLR